eukprot:4424371-Prymnesium_polylepis.1
MPVLIGAILTAIPPLVNVSALCAFIFTVFGIVGVELFKGSMHYRCASPGFEPTPGHPSLLDQGVRRLLLADTGGGAGSEGEYAAAMGATEPALVNASAALGIGLQTLLAGAASGYHRLLKGGGGGGGASSDGSDGGASQLDFDSGVFCNPLEDKCAEELGPGISCQYFDDNPNGGVLSFDSVPYAAVAIFQTITFDTWTDPMYAIMATVTPLGFIYSVRRRKHARERPSASARGAHTNAAMRSALGGA